MTPLRFGVIGMSEGNGHPYSWSAIFNGYEPEAMRACPFPAIPDYLARQRFPEDAIPDARVTMVWTEDRREAEHIARASRISEVASDFRDFIGRVDGVLLARDDAVNHPRFAVPFLEAGLPVYIDKPLALSVAAAERLFERETYAGQIFACSALRYASELRLDDAARREIGEIVLVEGVTAKDWDRYAVHLIEPVLAGLGRQGAIVESRAFRLGATTVVGLRWASGLGATFTATGSGAAPIVLRVFGTRGWRELVFRDSFAAFKTALATFVRAVRERRPQIPREFVLDVVAAIEAGRATA